MSFALRIFCGILFLALECSLYGSAMPTGNKMVIQSPMDLQGQELNLSAGTTLFFQNDGCIINGVVRGEHIVVKADEQQIFSNVRLIGTFTAEEAKSVWFDAKGDCRIGENGEFISGTDNTEAFQNLFLFDNIDISPGSYLIKNQLSCKSNQIINGGGALLKFLHKGNCILIDGDSEKPIKNIKIRNLHIIGSKNDYSDKTEFWMGIRIGFVDKVEIENVSCNYCRGDGFYIGTSIRSINDRVPRNIILRRVKSYYNHRQGLSITRASGVKVLGSEFCYTSGTNPQAGIDVEPNMKELDDGTLSVGICENVLIANCLFKGNKKEGIKLSDYYHYSSIDRHVYGINVSNCSFEEDNLSIYGVADSKFEHLSFKNSVIDIKGRNAISNISLSDIRMRADEGNTISYAIWLGYHESRPQRTNIVLNNIHVKGYEGAAIRVDSEWPMKNGKPMQIKVINCESKDCGAEIVYGKQELLMSMKEKALKIGAGWLFLLSIGGVGVFAMRKLKANEKSL